jgi:Na+/melibiose symporter-like transporter
MIEYYLVDFMISTAKLSGGYTGLATLRFYKTELLFSTILLITELLGVVIGPVAGYFMDNNNYKFGKHRFWIMVCILPLGVCFASIWYIPDIESSVGKGLYYSTAIVLFNVFYAVVLIAYEGMIPLLIAGAANSGKSFAT